MMKGDRGKNAGGTPTLPSTIRTFTGRLVNPLALRVEDVCIEDIAHALALTCRFNGHTLDFYSVAQHSVLVMRWLRVRCEPVAIQMQGLLHDAGEAYAHDVVRPLKPYYSVAGMSYARLEEQIQHTVFSALGVPWPMDGVIDTADEMLLEAEKQVFMDGEECNLFPMGFYAWRWELAEDWFLTEYRYLHERMVADEGVEAGS